MVCSSCDSGSVGRVHTGTEQKPNSRHDRQEFPAPNDTTTERRDRPRDSTIERLRRRLARESERTLGLAMHFPIGWDPYFKDVMTVGDVYHYPTQHYEHHRRQLTTRRALEI
jgi:hypothetical protein